MSTFMDRIKLIVVGDSGVGKSTFVNSLVSHSLCRQSSSTIGCNVEVLPYAYTGQIGHGHPGNVFLEFFDMGGSSGNKHSRSIFYSNPNGLILVHDLSNRKSFSNLSRWLKEVLNSCKEELTGVSIRDPKDFISYSPETAAINNKVPILILGLKEDQSSAHSNQHAAHDIGVTDGHDTFLLDMDCQQLDQLLPCSKEWTNLCYFFDRVIETRFHASSRSLSQESEYWRGRKKIF